MNDQGKDEEKKKRSFLLGKGAEGELTDREDDPKATGGYCVAGKCNKIPFKR